MIYCLPSVRGRLSGFEELGRLAAATKDLFAGKLTLDFSSVGFIDANMAAPLGAILARVSDELNHIEIVSVPKPVEQILRKNGFLTSYWYEPLTDDHNTTMPFQRFRPTEIGAFTVYVGGQLWGKQMPRMSAAAEKVFKNKVFEIYQNAVTHSESRAGIFVCGQFFPKIKRLRFTISDTGIGIPGAVRRHFDDVRISSTAAIRWALAPHHTTKRGSLPGGLGLDFLHEFTRLNGGTFQIASRYGFYEFSGGSGDFCKMAADLPGTTVTIEVNTADQSTYVLDTETGLREPV